MSNLFRHIPAVDKLLADQKGTAAAEGLSRNELTALIQGFLADLRKEIASSGQAPEQGEIRTRLTTVIGAYKRQRFQEVINATGVLLHTNLGRAPLPEVALERLRKLGSRYFNLELDLVTGERGSRYTNVAGLFNLLAGSAERDVDTVVVNNNAAAVLVTLKALAADAEVIVSRGQLVEIGGGFRIPEVIAASGCILKEVGTTNRTRLSDYAQAITERTKAILLVHPSNYSIIGFTETVPRAELAQLAAENGLLLLEDIGSGAFPPFPEPLVTTALKHSHIVTYSGDKLLGGAQAGIITGRRDLIEVIKREPLLRAMRIDKLSLLALEAVLEQYLNNDLDKLPLWAMTQMPAEEIKARAEGWLAELGPELEGKVLPTFSTMGGGSLPGETIPSWALVLTSATYSAQRIYDWLRLSNPAVMGRIVQDKVWLDPRTVLPEQDREVVAILRGGIS